MEKVRNRILNFLFKRVDAEICTLHFAGVGSRDVFKNLYPFL